MARRLAPLAIALVLLAPMAVAIVPLETFQTRVALRGYDDDVARVPAAGLRESTALGVAPVIPAVPSACMAVEDCETLVPREQYHWFELLLRDLEGEPVRNVDVRATFKGFQGGSDVVVLRPDLEGFAWVLRRPVAENVVSVELELPDGTRATYWWVVQGVTLDPTVPTVIRGEGRVVEALVEILRPDHFWVDQHARIVDRSLTPASALVSDATALREGHLVYGLAAYAAFSEPHDVQLAVTALDLQEDADLPVNLTSVPGSVTFDVRGNLSVAISFVAHLGHAGDGAEVALRVFGPRDAYRVTVRDVGDLVVAAPRVTGVRASAADVGVLFADVEATLDVATPGAVLTDALVPVGSAGSIAIRHDARSVTADSDLLSETVRYFIDDGSCQGAWSVKLGGYLGLIEPSAAIAHAENYGLPAWARDDFPTTGTCGP